jgi:hypothetical protein
MRRRIYAPLVGHIAHQPAPIRGGGYVHVIGRRIHALLGSIAINHLVVCHMRRRIHAWHTRMIIHACHMRRRIHCMRIT